MEKYLLNQTLVLRLSGHGAGKPTQDRAPGRFELPSLRRAGAPVRDRSASHHRAHRSAHLRVRRVRCRANGDRAASGVQNAGVSIGDDGDDHADTWLSSARRIFRQRSRARVGLGLRGRLGKAQDIGRRATPPRPASCWPSASSSSAGMASAITIAWSSARWPIWLNRAARPTSPPGHLAGSPLN